MAWSQGVNLADLPDAGEMVDPMVNVHLLSGSIIQLQQVSVVKIAQHLHNNGFVFLADGEGSYAVFFSHGVAALTVKSATDT